MLSCAYYNILWTANKEYNKATRALDFAEFWDPYEQKKLTGEQTKLVDSAASRCGKVLLLHPDSKWVDDALLLMGKCFLLSQDYEKALKKFREIDVLYSAGDLAEEARYLEAYTLVLYDSADEAILKLRDLINKAKGGEIKEKAGYLLPRVAFERGDCAVAVEGFSAYLRSHPGGSRAGAARLALGECLVKLGMYRQAIEDLQPLLGEVDATGARALLKAGMAHRMLGETTEAIGVFKRVLENAGEDSLRSRAGIEEALTLLEDGQPQAAIERLVLADSLGDWKLTGEINYRIGTIYERQLGDFDEAIAHYDEAQKRKSPHSGAAGNRSRALKSLKTYQGEIAEGTGDVAKCRYLLAETYLYDLNMQERAMEELMVVCDSFPDSEYAARSMLAIAACLQAEGDVAAVGYYKRIIEDFPETPYANVARIQLGLPPIDVVVEEPGLAPGETESEPDTLGVSGHGMTSPAGGPPGMKRPLPRPPEGIPGSVRPAPGDTLAEVDSSGARAMFPPGFETPPGLPDSVKDRYDEYMRYSMPAPSGEDTTGLDTTGVYPGDEEE